LGGILVEPLAAKMAKASHSYKLTLRQINAARRAFETREPRGLFYRAATELVSLALRRNTSLTLAEALAVLLQTWNKAFYQFTTRFDKRHFADIERVIRKRRRALLLFRHRAIPTLSKADRPTVKTLFADFERVVGPVGAAKSLHLLAPHFFPLWDREIARKYSVALGKRGSNSDRYYRFMEIAQEQCRGLRSKRGTNWNPLKAIDEYNYSRYTRRWI
jgi:hypothetical protein